MEISQDNQKKIIAFYLPQYHTIPENDEWWGKGFTEWTNTKKAKPLFEGHEQPKTPLHHRYYDLSDVTVMEQQAQMAKEYGVFGFCYYHYWFKDGKKLLEKPVDNMLREKKVDIPFCICWANENWSRNWDGGNRELLMEQDYGSIDDWKKHFAYLLTFFRDERYMTYKGAPILVIYKPEEICQFNQMRECFDHLAKAAGFTGIRILAQYPTAYFEASAKKLTIDYFIKFEPVMATHTKYHAEHDGIQSMVKSKVKAVLGALHAEKVIQGVKNIKNDSPAELTVLDYDATWDVILNMEPEGEKIISGGFTAWDNTARNVCGKVYQGSTPEKFGTYMEKLLQKDTGMGLVFVNAWNEWAEGAYLEPDERYGFGYLEALRRALESQQKDTK